MPNPIRESTVHSESPSHSIPGMNGGGVVSGNMLGVSANSNMATFTHVGTSGGGVGMGGASGGVSTSRKRPHDAQELISIARKVMKLNKDALDARLMQVFIRQSELNIFELTTLKKRGPALTTFLKNHSLRDPDEIIAAIQAEVPQHREKVVVSRALLSDKSQLGVSAPMGTPVPHVPSLQPEIKLAGAGGIPVAISTTLPPAVARLSQQQGGTPLDPCRTPDKLSSGPGALKAAGPGSRLSSGGGGRLDPADQIAEKAKQEAYVLQRVASLQREGLWFEKRLPKVAEPTRTKAHWDYLLEEMTWISTDFAQERKWKKAMARKIARSIQKHFQEKKQLQLRAEKAAETHARKLASYMARGVKQFWNNVGKLVEFKQTTLLEEKRKQALDQHLSFIVGETEKFSSLVAESMNKPALGSGPSSLNQDSAPVSLSDGEFQPDGEWSDDEETIEREEEQVKPTEQEREIEMLQKESELSLDDILDQLPPGYLEQRAKDIEGEGGRSRGDDQGADSDYSAASSDISSDDEQTLDEQEAAEARDASALDPASEVQELEADNALSLEELKAKYGGGGGGSGLDTPPQDEADVEMESEDEEEELSDEDDNLTGSDDQGSSADDLDDNDDLTSARSLDQETDSGLSSLLTDPSAGAGGLSSLLAESTGSAGGPGASAAGTGPSAGREGKDEAEADKKMNDVAALAESIQPKGYTLESTTVATPVPFLLQFPLREYQHVGLDWLVTMYERGLNGILADEMGLGKTIQTISLLAHLACEKGIWGPHLIVVPTSVLLNWEMELKKWAPGFKVLTYYGNIKERKAKRQGWTKPNSFHVCVTSYKLAVQDHQSFRRKAWRYLILDEAQNIKNFKSQRWQLLLNFNTERRLLLTGTPLQNNLNELWSLMHFLMPALFQSHSEFQAWFSHPMKDMIEGNSDYNETIVKRLHKVLRPFLLRRLKAQVEKQLPKKYEHVVMCRLSNRQKYLYDDFMSRTKTKETLANGTMLSVINILMQLRKVCNHPNLFEERATLSPFHMSTLQCAIPSIVFNALNYDVFKDVNLESMNLNLLYNELNLSLSQGFTMRRLRPPDSAILELDKTAAQQPLPPLPRGKPKLRVRCKDPKASVRVVIVNNSATNNNNKVVKTHAINIGNILVRQIICQGGIQGLNAKSSSLSGGAGAGAPGSAPTSTAPSLVTSGVSPAQVQGIPVQLVQRDGSRSTIKFLASAPRVIVQKSATGQVTSLIKLPAVISQASSVTPSPGSAVGSAGSAGVTTSQQSPTVQLFTSTLVPVSSAPTLTSRLSSSGSGGPGQVGFVTGTAAVGPGGTITTPSGAVLRVTGPGGNLVSLASRTTNALTSAIVTVSAAGLSTSSTLSTSGSDAAGGTLRRRKTVDNTTGSSENESTSASAASNLFVKPSLEEKRRARREAQLALAARVNAHRLEQPCLLYGSELRTLLRIRPDLPEANDLVVPGYEARVEQLKDVFDNFLVYVPAVTAPTPELRICHPHPSSLHRLRRMEAAMTAELRPKLRLLHPVTSAMCTQFPDPRLIQYDCGKLQSLDVILRKLKAGGHRVLIFTQMTRMLDVLEAFLNFHGHIYLRLDGTTKVDQRQVLMERFNMDARIFCFILSTRSGGVGINLTGADTVVFYDSDWNPTMDAQAQDRCHRIGQTRDVHIYRLISEKTIEENILRKANQKRLLGDLAIEGGNFTTAFFKSSTIQDLFNTEGRQESDASTRLADVLEPTPPVDKASLGALESALAAAEDATDVAAAKIAKAEAVADLAEFDESIPVTSLGEGQGESKAEQEVGALMEQLSGVERWAVSFYETKIAANGAGTEAAVAAAEAELAAVKRDWELDRLASLKREEARRTEAKAESRTELLTFAREDATNQVWIGSDNVELMPLWSPPTPPQDDNDVYIDFSLLFLYEPDIMSEASLPPIVRRDKKRLRQEVNSDGQPLSKIRHRDDVPPAVPRSLFDRPSPALLKLRHEVRLAKYRSGGIGSGRSASLPSSALAAGAALKAPGGVVGSKPPATPEPDPGPEWLIHEDMALLQAVHSLEIHPNLIVLAPGHTPNWDLVAELVNQVSRVYRSARSCQNRYENVLIAREEGKLMYDPSPKKHKTKNKLQIFTKIPQLKSGRSMRTAQLYAQDNNLTLTSLLVARYEAMHAIIDRRTPTTQSFKPLLVNSATNQNLWTHAEVLNSSQILYDQPLSPVEVAQKLAERIAKEKQANAASRGTTEQQQAAQLLIQQRRAAAAAQVAETAQQQAAAVAQQQQALAAQQQQALAAAQQQQQALAAAQQQQVLVAAQQQTATTASQSQQQAAAVQQIIQAQQAAQAGQQLTVQTQHGTLVQQQTVRQVATPVRTLQQQRTVNVSELVRSVQSVVAASSQQVATGQQIRTSAVTTAVVMSSSTQPIVTTRMITGSPAGTTTKPLTPSQLQLYKQQQLRQQQLRLLQQKAVAAAQVQQVVSSGGSVIQQTSSPVTIRAQAKPRTVTDAEMAILKRQMLQQAAAQQQSATQKAAVGSLLAQTSGAIQPGTQVTTLVKTLPPQTAGIIPQVKTLSAAQIKPTAAQFRQIQFQQQLIAQRKASSAAPTGGTTTAKVVKAAGVGGTTQLIVAGGGKSLTGTMTMQQIQQVIKQQIPHAGTINVSTSSGQVISHAVITKSPQVQQRTVIPVATSVSGAGGKQTIQVVTATPSSGGVARPTAQTIKVATGATSSSVSQQQQALLSQVTAAIQQGTMRPSPVRIQSASGQPIVAVAVSQSQQQATQQHHVIHHQSNPDQT